MLRQQASSSASPEPQRVTDDLELQIKTLETRLDGLIHRASHLDDTSAGAAEGEQQNLTEVVASADTSTGSSEPQNDTFSAPEPNIIAQGKAAPVTPSTYFRNKWGRKALASRSEEVDPFGLDPKYEEKFRPLIDLFYRRYFRVEAKGIHHVPDQGRCVIVSNHSGTLPLDGLLLRATMHHEHPARRELRWLAEDFLFHLPFAGVIMNRLGAVRACQENAERLLEQENALAVFPEGEKGVSKLYRERYRLQRFARGGFVRLCLRTQSPLIPCAIVGAEEANPMLYRLEYLPRLLGLPYLPITPTFPWLGPLGLMPAPSKWKITFGTPLNFEQYGPEAADDHLLVSRLSDEVQNTIDKMLSRSLADRKSVWFG